MVGGAVVVVALGPGGGRDCGRGGGATLVSVGWIWIPNRGAHVVLYDYLYVKK